VTSFRRLRDIFLVVVLLALPFFFLRATIRAPEDMHPLDRTINKLSAPLQYVAAAVARSLSGVINDYVYLVDVKDDNNKLAYENARLMQRLRELTLEQAENRRLRKLLSLRDTVGVETASALVVAKDTSQYFRVAQVVLDRPGVLIRPNMPVISVDGAVGTVLRVSGDKVDVRLTVDSGNGIDVVVERTRARGLVRGTGDPARYTLRVQYMERSDQVEVGDLLLTSGVGCRFPRGIPVARVKEVKKREFGIYQTVEAEPTVDFSRLEEVLITLSDTKECEQKPNVRTRK